MFRAAGGDVPADTGEDAALEIADGAVDEPAFPVLDGSEEATPEERSAACVVILEVEDPIIDAETGSTAVDEDSVEMILEVTNAEEAMPGATGMLVEMGVEEVSNVADSVLPEAGVGVDNNKVDDAPDKIG